MPETSPGELREGLERLANAPSVRRDADHAPPADATTGSGGAGGRESAGGGSPGRMSLGEFQVALQDLHAAIGIVRSESGTVSGLIGRIQSHFDAAQSFWQSPAASTFETTASWFTTSSRALEDLLNEMVGRLQTAYDNYVAAERANTNNLGG